MHQYPYMFLFSFTLISSTLMAVSSSHWLMVWMSLELNMISFIPILTHSSWFQETEASMKYLLFQAMGSAFILMSAINSSLSIFILLGLLIKLGAAPFHFWFPSVMSSISWASATLLLTWQKIAPMMILINTSSEFGYSLLPILGATSALVGGLGGMTQTRLRPMLAYSSIGHMGWMISVSSFSPMTSMIYFISYLFISVPILWSALKTSISMNKKSYLPKQVNVMFCLFPTIMSLSGLPPLFGFMPKILSLLMMPSIIIPLLLILGSLINLSYYLNFFFSIYLSQSSSKKNTDLSLPLMLSLLVWLASSPVPLIFIIMYML